MIPKIKPRAIQISFICSDSSRTIIVLGYIGDNALPSRYNRSTVIKVVGEASIFPVKKWKEMNYSEYFIYFTASYPPPHPRGGPRPEIDPYKRHAHIWHEPNAMRLTRKERKEKKNVCRLDLWSQPRNWAQFIHEFICRLWVGLSRSAERGNGRVGVAKAAFGSINERSFDSGSDKSYPSV